MNDGCIDIEVAVGHVKSVIENEVEVDLEIVRHGMKVENVKCVIEAIHVIDRNVDEVQVEILENHHVEKLIWHKQSCCRWEAEMNVMHLYYYGHIIMKTRKRCYQDL